MDPDSDIGWWLAVIVSVLLAISIGALIFLIVMVLLVGWHRGYSRPRLRLCIAGIAVAFVLGWLASRPMALQVMPSLSSALGGATSICRHPGMARNASFATERGCE